MAHDEALAFLQKLESYLNDHIEPPPAVRKRVRQIVSDAMLSGDEKSHLRQPEGAFLNTYITPWLHEFLKTELGWDNERAKASLLSESYKNIPNYAANTPASNFGVPFTKAGALSVKDLIKRWREGHALMQACPDLALRSPCPHRIVIEGKYFARGATRTAETALVEGIHECFFYRGLSRLSRRSENDPRWDYDYGCLIAYDATEQSYLFRTWKDTPEKTRTGFWDGGGIYIMILTGKGAAC